MKRSFATVGTLMAALVLTVCGRSPTDPTGTGAIDLHVPAEIAPGASVQLSAVIVRSFGIVEDITDSVEWHTSNAAVLTVSVAGLAKGIAAGEADVLARYRGRSATARTLVLPINTFRLIGRLVDELGAGISGASVTVIAGIGQGLTSATSAAGDYALFGVSGQVRLEATKAGYRSELLDIDVTAHRTFDVRLAAQGTLRDLEGTYALTIAAGECQPGGSLLTAARTRTYTATVAQAGERLDVVLTGADLIVTGGRGDRFAGVVGLNDDVTFSIGEDDGSFYYYETAQWDLVERFSDQSVIIVHGTVVATPTPSGMSGVLAGAINLAQSSRVYAFYSRCLGRHNFDMVKR